MSSDPILPSRRGFVAGCVIPIAACSHEAGKAADRSGVTGRRSASVLDFGARGDGRTDDTRAIQAALDAVPHVHLPGTRDGRRYLFHELVLHAETRLDGDGPRASILQQIDGGPASALRLSRESLGRLYDISEGALALERIGIEVVSRTGIAIGPGTPCSMLRSDNLRIVHRHATTLRSPPYTTPSDSCGISVDGAEAPVFMAHHQNLEIRSFDTAIRARKTVNEWHVHGWLIDCRIGLDLADVSTWMLELSFETGVPAARMLALTGEVANLILDGGRCEITQQDGYMFAFDERVRTANIRIRNPNVVIVGDGGAWPGRKFTGPLPSDVVFDLSRAGQPLVAASPGTTLTIANGLRVGGTTLGDGQLVLGRDAGGGDAVLANAPDGRLRITGLNGVRLGAGAPSVKRLDISDLGLGFHDASPIEKPVVTGSRQNNAALASLLEALQRYGLITDKTS